MGSSCHRCRSRRRTCHQKTKQRQRKLVTTHLNHLARLAHLTPGSMNGMEVRQTAHGSTQYPQAQNTRCLSCYPMIQCQRGSKRHTAVPEKHDRSIEV